MHNHSPTNEKTGKMTTNETVAFKGSDSSTALFHSEQKENLQGGKMQQQFQEEYDRYPKTVRTYEIDGKKYVVTGVYVGNKDFKKVFGDLAFSEALKDTE